MRTPAHEIDAFVRQKQRWIAKAVDARCGPPAATPSDSSSRATRCRTWARTLRLRVVEGVAEGVRRVEGGLEVRVDAQQGESERRAAVRQRVEGWYKSQADLVLRERVRFFAPLVGAMPTRVLVKTQKTRWGSCGKDGALRLNWALIIAPLPVIDYLVVHELCHLRRGRTRSTLLAAGREGAAGLRRAAADAAARRRDVPVVRRVSDDAGGGERV